MSEFHPIYTIGHSNQSSEDLIERLQQHQITALADVRSHPYSRYLPHFDRSALKASLPIAGIQYVFLGQELGARPNDLSCYVRGKALYDRIAATALFQHGIDRLLKGAANYTICLMCAEKDPIDCHRSILICQHLKAHNLSIAHIRKTGELESHEQLEERLLKLHKLHPLEQASQQLSLFDSVSTLQPQPQTQQERLQQAYQLQSDKIAYIDKPES